MDSKQKVYIGVSVNPIYATLLRTSTLPGMWFVSTMFSRISEQLCKVLVEKGVAQEKIFSLYHTSSPEIPTPDGVGLYNDRILFEAESGFERRLPHCIWQVKKRLACAFASSLREAGHELWSTKKTIQFLREYLQLHFVCISEAALQDSPMLDLNRALDAAELRESYLYRAQDGLLTAMLEGKAAEEGGQNQAIKRSFLMCRDPFKPYHPKENAIQPQILNAESGKLRNVLDVAIGDEAYDAQGNRKTLPPEKHKRYWALVKADGDNMGKRLAQMRNLEEVHAFSRCCFAYGAEAANCVGDHGGMTIYAGGDDLLFLAPTKDILTLCKEINAIYQEHFARFSTGEGDAITLSIGVCLCFYRYPLYEALPKAGELLQKAKDAGHNRIALSLEKAAGKEIAFILKHATEQDTTPNVMHLLLDFLNVYESFAKTAATSERCLVWLQSAVHTVAQHRALFLQALKNADSCVTTVFENLFHQDVHQQKEAKVFLQTAAKLFEALAEEAKAEGRGTDGDREKILDDYDAILRFVRFFGEKGERE